MTMELIIASLLVLTMISCATPVVIRCGRIWQETRHIQLATDELSGQLDRLLAMPPGQRETALAELSPSPAVADALDDVALTAEISEGNNGKRIVVAIDWKRPGDPQPLKLVGWLDPFPIGERGDAPGEQDPLQQDPPQDSDDNDAKGEDAA
jgi:hypothetical protein